MKKHFMLLLFVVAAACAILWAVLSDPKSKNDQPAVGTSDELETIQTADAGSHEETKPEAAIPRESPRHAAGDLEKSRKENSLAALNQAVLEQEAKVEERKMVLSTLVRTRRIFFKDGEESQDQSREEAIERGLDARAYVDAKREFEADLALLQHLKLKLTGETISAKVAEADPKKKDSGK